MARYILSMALMLHIRFGQVELLHSNGLQESCFSVQHQSQHYFSASFTHESLSLNCDVLIPLPPSPPQTLWLHRWQNCLIVFSKELQLGDLPSRLLTKRKIQTRHQQLLSLSLHILPQAQFMLSDRYNPNIAQHYCIVQDLFQQGHKQKQGKGPSYFVISSGDQQFILPLRQSIVALKLPCSLTITSFVDSRYNGKSRNIAHQQLNGSAPIKIEKDGKVTAQVTLKLRWGVNLHRFQGSQTALADSMEVLLYDFQLKFDNPSVMRDLRFKVMQGTRGFQFSEDLDQNKITKIKKIVHFLSKSEADQIDFLLLRKDKVLMQCRATLADIKTDQLTLLRKKWLSLQGTAQPQGFIRVKAQRGSNLSTPQWNRQWRECNKRKNTATTMLLTVFQPSVYYPQDLRLNLVSKVETDEKTVKPLNLNFYSEQEPRSQILQFPLKAEENVYFILKKQEETVEFQGIGVLSTADLRLGLNACEIVLFKNQERTGVVNCQLNKMLFWPFVRVMHQSQPMLPPTTPVDICVSFRRILLSPYYHTYQYDNKLQLYCIVQIARMKRVLILQSEKKDPLSFLPSAESDALDYTIQHPTIKIKITFMVSDLGHQEEIYGSAVALATAQQAQNQTVQLNNVPIKNQADLHLGSVSFDLAQTHNSHTTQDQKSKGSWDLSQASFDVHTQPVKKQPQPSPSRRYSGGYIASSKPEPHNFLRKQTHAYKPDVKLPVIKEKKGSQQLNDLLNMMKVRKRALGGNYQVPPQPNQPSYSVPRRHGRSFDLRKLEQSNPNISRNLQILFPKKANQRQIQQNRLLHNQQSSQLKGFKSVMDQIGDVGTVQPTIREYVRTPQEAPSEDEYVGQWEGNQFV